MAGTNTNQNTTNANNTQTPPVNPRLRALKITGIIIASILAISLLAFGISVGIWGLPVVLDAMMKAAAIISGNFSIAGGHIASAATATGSYVSAGATAAGAKISSAASVAGTHISSAASTAWTGTSSAASAAGAHISSAASTAWAGTSSAVSAAGAHISSAASTAWVGTSSAASAAGTHLSNAAVVVGSKMSQASTAISTSVGFTNALIAFSVLAGANLLFAVFTKLTKKELEVVDLNNAYMADVHNDSTSRMDRRFNRTRRRNYHPAVNPHASQSQSRGDANGQSQPQRQGSAVNNEQTSQAQQQATGGGTQVPQQAVGDRQFVPLPPPLPRPR